MSGTVESASEKLARRRLEPRIGLLEPADVPGTSGLPDYRIAGEGDRGHVEVTSSPDKRVRRQRAAIRKRPQFKVSTPGRGTLYLHRNVDTRSLPRAPELEVVLEAAIRTGKLMTSSNCPDVVRNLMDSLGIEAVSYKDTGEVSGTVSLSGGTTGAWGVQGEGVDEWLEQTFEQAGVVSHVEKLVRAGGASRHLYLEVDSSSVRGLAIAIGLDAATGEGAAPYRLPEFKPPQHVTDLWVWPDSPGPGLHFVRELGWEIVLDVPWE